MEELDPRRPWWRKKRWGIALSFWLTAAYPLSYGPALGYWWADDGPWVDAAFRAVYAPMERLRLDGPPACRGPLRRYVGLWLPDGWDRPSGCVWVLEATSAAEMTPDGGP